jgi:D-alanyl-lipoteichoic acid acyltransferase DltB (MBOAT superfamily)
MPEGAPLPEFFNRIVLPIGISFYTFQSLSYTIGIDWNGVFEQTRTLFGTGSNVHFVEFTDLLEQNRFYRYSHVDREGLRLIAERLAEEISAVKNDSL